MASGSALIAFLAMASMTASAANQGGRPPRRPRLMVAAGPMIGPRVPGESACQWQSGTRVCEHTGHFFGVGANLELRVRALGPLYMQGRGIVLSNVKPRPDGVHSGIAGFGLGVGAYSRLAFVRMEYLFVPTFGPATFGLSFDVIAGVP